VAPFSRHSVEFKVWVRPQNKWVRVRITITWTSKLFVNISSYSLWSIPQAHN